MEIPFDKLPSDYGEWSKAKIAEWREMALHASEQEDFRKHPSTVKLAKLAQENIDTIEAILKTVEEITEIDRKVLFREKKVHKIYLELFTRDTYAQLEQINKLVSEELL